MPTDYLLLFTANLAFILTNVYGWLLKWFYKPKAYNENFVQLFPAYKPVGLFYLLQVLELPYLLRIGRAIRRVNEDTYADIAAQCGFTSQSSMTKAFASQGKQSPSSYRKKA